jgi:alpha-tubulin suppressor-like RCC1 family protein
MKKSALQITFYFVVMLVFLGLIPLSAAQSTIATPQSAYEGGGTSRAYASPEQDHYIYLSLAIYRYPLEVHHAVWITTGRDHTCAVTDKGVLKCWGENTQGQLGDGTHEDRWGPVDVYSLSQGAAVVSGGSIHTCAVTTTGGVRCWGYNGAGQLGDGTTSMRDIPVEVVGLNSGAAEVVAGGNHSCALMVGGGVKCWGSNFDGELGDGTLEYSSTPVDVIGLAGPAVALTAGHSHNCALIEDGGVQCWGLNENGQLGDGTTTNRSTPVGVMGLSGGVVNVEAGTEHTCALLATGGVKCWGLNDHRQLGDGTTDERWEPVDVLGLTDTASAITAGYGHSCALMTGGGAMCWGWNEMGQLGEGTNINWRVPVDVFGLSGGETAIAAGYGHSCVIVDDGEIKCWGLNSTGQLGDGTGTTWLFPRSVIGFGGVYPTYK